MVEKDRSVFQRDLDLEKKEKKKYEKPGVTRICLDPKTAVLGTNCKYNGYSGINPSVLNNCNSPSFCSQSGS
jgi:hypothetical protein